MHVRGGRSILALGVAVAAASVTAHARVTVSLHGRAEPEGRIVRVCDVARVEGDEPALVERVGAVLLGAAPRGGRVRTIGRNHIRTRIFHSGIPLATVSTGGESLVLVLPPREGASGLGRAGIEPVIAPGDDIVKVIRRHAAREVRRPEGALEAELVSLQWVRRPARADGEDHVAGGCARAEYRWTVAGRAHGPALGRARYMLSAVTDGERVGQALVWAVVSPRKDRLAERPLERAALTGRNGATEGVTGSLFDRPAGAIRPSVDPAEPTPRPVAREPEVERDVDIDGPAPPARREAEIGRECDRAPHGIRERGAGISPGVPPETPHGTARLPRPAEDEDRAPAKSREAVSAGRIVTVVSDAAPSGSTKEARAERSGAVGDVITVHDPRSGKTYLARVIDEDLVAAVP